MKSYFLISMIFVLLGCEVIVDVKIPEEKPKLTLNSFFNPDSVWLAHLSLNRHVLNNEKKFQRIEEALVVVYEGESPIDTLISKGNGIYKSETGKPLAGKNYRIEATTKSHEIVSARSNVPGLAEIISLDIRESSSILNNTGTNFTIKFKDDPTVKNYYQIFLEIELDFLSQDGETDIVGSTIEPYNIESNDPAIQHGNLNFRNGILVKDIFHNGEEVEISFHTFNPGKLFPSSVIVTLRTLSEDYFNYLTTLELQRTSTGDPFALPINVYNNIDNGYGIFGGYSQSVFIRSFPKPVISSFSPLNGRPGDHVIIKGENFGVRPEGFSDVFFKGSPFQVSAQTISESESQLEVIVPPNAVSGKIIVFTNGRVAVSAEDFEIIN